MINDHSKKFKVRFLRTTVILAVFIFSASTAQAAVFLVDNVTDNGALTACTAAPGDCSLRGALANANLNVNTDTINIAATLFGQTINLVNGELPILANSTLRINGGLSSQITISAGGSSRVFFINAGALVQIRSLNITGGSIAGAGGGIYNDGGDLILLHSAVYNNAATTRGGGLFNTAGGTARVINSTISGNSATSFGGGIENFSGTLTVINSTITNNSSLSGGGFEILSGTAHFKNTIIANSTSGGDCARAGGTVNAEYSLIEGGLGCVNGTNSNNLTGDPNLDPSLTNNGGRTLTHALLCPSIANDSGSNALAVDHNGDPLTEDQRDVNTFPRIFNSIVDRGAFEIQQVCNQPPVALCQDVTVTLAPYQTTAAADINNGSYDPDGDPITLSYAPPGPYPPGQTVVTLTVDDGQETDSCQGTVTVLYLFKWYTSSDLLSNPPPVWLIQATAGNDVNLRFSLYGYKGDNVYSSPPTWQRISCISKAPLAPAFPAQIRGLGVVHYNALFDFYQTTLITNAAWAGTCYRASIYLNDGTTKSLDYQFK